MRSKIRSRLLIRYFLSTCTEKEKSIVETWISANPKNRAEFERLRSIWELPSHRHESWDPSDSVERLNVIMRENKGNPRLYRISVPHETGPSFFKPALRFGAGLTVLVGLFFSAGYLKDMVSQKESRSPNGNFLVQKASTRPGRQMSLQFADGTKIILNSASELKYGTSKKGIRNVYLKGEAYFEVVHSESHPFIVHAGGVTVRDIGTKFDVRAWADERNLTIAVVKGMVSVRSRGRHETPMLLRARQYSVLTKSGDLIPPTYTSDITKYTEWMDGKYSFKNDPFRQVTRQIWRTYGIRCFVSDTSILNRKITTSFSGGDPAGRTISIISLSLHLTYRRSGDSVLFTPSGMSLMGRKDASEPKSDQVKNGGTGE